LSNRILDGYKIDRLKSIKFESKGIEKEILENAVNKLLSQPQGEGG